jgi:hypothetical protein
MVMMFCTGAVVELIRYTFGVGTIARASCGHQLEALENIDSGGYMIAFRREASC